MNIDYLITFLEVIRQGSFSEVAKKLSITQPAVSFQINKLERDLGVKLIDRGKKTLTLTDAGQRLLRFAEVIEQEKITLTRDLEKMRDEVTGDLIIAASTIPGEVLLPPMLGEFKALHPSICVRLDISDSMVVINGVHNGDYDIGFCGVAPEGRDLHCFKIANDEIVLVVFPEHPFARRKTVSLAEVGEEQIILREETSGTQLNIQSLFRKAGLRTEGWSCRMVLGTTQAVVAAVESRLGIAFVSNLAIEKSLALGLVKQVEVEGMQLKRDFYCVYRQERVVTRLLGEFISFVEERARRL